MNNKSCSRVRLTKGNRTRDLVAFTAVAVVALVWSAPARADVPAWMRSVASNPLPKYSAETNAVLLYDETTIAVKDAGEVHSIHRRVYRILRPSGRDRGVFGWDIGSVVSNPGSRASGAFSGRGAAIIQ